MQPKPIDERHLIDIDVQNRVVDMMEGIHLIESPAELAGPQAEIDYDVARANRNPLNRGNSATALAERLKRIRAERARKRGELTDRNKPGEESNIDNEKGTHLDIVA